ncbi:hypothetical protein CAPTEDRAFT_198998 [Capitella teleta]|uniref:RNA helicase aquarius n=1 Tax=Capitella teleta TaxID=283909 RepID=R7TQ39_CAPTE|nr:hypothetical protein CAPTEDRAFT_198998 [Capitella teleta]|eukprot:ELT95764.1 hypothetical protein CAPTEDRAFT_198998 [Capitella teleta]
MVKGKPKSAPAPTVEQIQADEITQVANDYWAPHSTQAKKPFNPKVSYSLFSVKRVMLLEFSQYLENYLWPNFKDGQASQEHVLSIVAMVNEKFRERVPAWEAFKSKPEQFPAFFRQMCELSLKEDELTPREQTLLMVFLIQCFNSLGMDLIRTQAQRLVSLTIWVHVLPARREEVFKSNPKYRKFWALTQKQDAKLDEDALKKVHFERSFLKKHIDKFLKILATFNEEGEIDAYRLQYCERFLELLIDLEAQLPTRRFFNLLLDDSHLMVKAQLSALAKRSEGRLFLQLLEMLNFYTGFEINDQTGEALTDHEMTELHYDSITSLQKAAFRDFPDLRKFALSNVANIDTRKALQKHFGGLSKAQLNEIAVSLHLVKPFDESNKEEDVDAKYLEELLISKNERRISQLEALNQRPLYPTEELVWDENVVPVEFYSGEGCLALPKLNLQFLTLHDYLLRNFHLFRLESTYEIRQNIEDSVIRMKPWKAEDGGCYFGGWARMAHPMINIHIMEVAKPNIGENHPARVRADITINLNLRQEIKREWENLRKHDVLFLITLRPPNAIGTLYDRSQPFVSQVGLTYIRGCEVEGLLDEHGRVIEEGPEVKPTFKGDNRSFRVWLDPNQYQHDMTMTMDGHEDIYETFNVVMRRKPKENNFKAVLETIRDLMNTDCVVPDWLHDIILGLRCALQPIATMDWNDTFLDIDHLKSSFPDHTVEINDRGLEVKAPFRLTFGVAKPSLKRKHGEEAEKDEKSITVEPFVPLNRGPYEYSKPRRNQVPFTPTQVEAIRSGMQPGLTLVVGPPGTGKTDVAVQIISNLYHNFPEQRTLIVTHSNQALNQLFEKIIALDVDERHLLRMGHGEESLETEKDFSRYGRVNYVLAQRLELLDEVSRLKESLGVPGDVEASCETAGHFYLYHVLARWEPFLARMKSRKNKPEVQHVAELFPFTKYFSNAPQPLFKGQTFEEDFEIAEGCYRHIQKIFTQLEEFRAMELLRMGAERTRFLLVKEAKIIAMTCTHAALKRRDLVEQGFQYDNILMEESAQILEIETFIPLLLQNPKDGINRLKRWIMIGDHHQLPPVIKNMAFQKFSNMEQSLFTRFVKLGIPTVDLDAQGRARPSICNLYNWRYKKLGNLPHVTTVNEYKNANAGFFYDFQLIDVGDFNGVGESEPNPYFYQNLAEAEYVVAVFMYLRLLGYPAHKISILTTYNGQKHLIRDVIQKRCLRNALIGAPHKVTTVDRYQGQQNDIILLSLVKTKNVGHLRDVRRLIVAMSRARLGLYVFARVSLFQNCFELTPAFSQLMQRPMKLMLAPSERAPGRTIDHQRHDANGQLCL